MSCCCSMKRCIFFLLFLVIFVALVHTWLSYKRYVFSDSAVAAIGKKHAVKDSGTTDMKPVFKAIHKDLRAKFPGHILPASDLQWMFVTAGGMMYSMCVVHASLTEYVVFLGTNFDITGHSGRYWANISTTVLAGEYQQWDESEFTVNVHKPGTTVPHGLGSVTAVKFKAGTWMLEYARGFIPSTVNLCLSDILFGTQDFVTLFYMVRVYARCLLQEAGYYMAHFQELFA